MSEQSNIMATRSIFNNSTNTNTKTVCDCEHRGNIRVKVIPPPYISSRSADFAPFWMSIDFSKCPRIHDISCGVLRNLQDIRNFRRTFLSPASASTSVPADTAASDASFCNTTHSSVDQDTYLAASESSVSLTLTTGILANPPHHTCLWMDGCLLPPLESSSILRDGDKIQASVRPIDLPHFRPILTPSDSSPSEVNSRKRTSSQSEGDSLESARRKTTFSTSTSDQYRSDFVIVAGPEAESISHQHLPDTVPVSETVPSVSISVKGNQTSTSINPMGTCQNALTASSTTFNNGTAQYLFDSSKIDTFSKGTSPSKSKKLKRKPKSPHPFGTDCLQKKPGPIITNDYEDVLNDLTKKRMELLRRALSSPTTEVHSLNETDSPAKAKSLSVFDNPVDFTFPQTIEKPVDVHPKSKSKSDKSSNVQPQSNKYNADVSEFKGNNSADGCLSQCNDTLGDMLLKHTRRSKRSRRKHKKSKKAESVVPAVTPEPKVESKDYSMNLPWHQRPQCQRMVFNADEEENIDVEGIDSAGDMGKSLLTESKSTRHNETESANSRSVNTSHPGKISNTDEGISLGKGQSEGVEQIGKAIDSQSKFNELLGRRRKGGRNKSAVTESTMNSSSAADKNEDIGKVPSSQSIGDLSFGGSSVADSDWMNKNGFFATPEIHGSSKKTQPDVNSCHDFDQRTPLETCQASKSSNKEASSVPTNYEALPKFTGFPEKGDIIAYKVLELTEDYSPSVSDYMELRVISFDKKTSAIVGIRLGQNLYKKKRTGRFELDFGDSDSETEEQDQPTPENMFFNSMMDPRVVSRE